MVRTGNISREIRTEKKRYLKNSYEKDNHLGNVLAVVSDQWKTNCTPVTVGEDVVFVYENYQATVVQATDYSAFGAPLPGRTYVLSASFKSRYTFNGKEGDSEISGEGNTVDFGARIFDSRIGRFFSTDPEEMEFIGWSPYLYAANCPIKLIDVNGEGPGNPNQKDQTQAQLRIRTARLYTNQFKYGHSRPYSPKAKDYDCAAFVTFILQQTDPLVAKTITNNYTEVYTSHQGMNGGMISRMKKLSAFHNNPQVGDIAVWTGHMEFVSWVNPNGEQIRTFGARNGVVPNEIGSSKGYQWMTTGYTGRNSIGSIGAGKLLGYWTVPTLDNSTTTPPPPIATKSKQRSTTSEPEDNRARDGGELPPHYVKGTATPRVLKSPPPIQPVQVNIPTTIPRVTN